MTKRIMTQSLKSLTLAGLISSLTWGIANAATQGSLGSTSEGTADLDLSVGGFVRISNLSDIDLGTWDGSTDMTGNATQVCVYSNSGTSEYKIKAQVTGKSANDFSMDGQGSISGSTLDFAPTWTPTTGATPVALTSSDQTVSGANTASTDCNGGADGDSTLGISVSSGDLETAPTGDYAATIEITVSAL